MATLKRFWAIVVVVAKRLTAQPWLAIATVLGLVVAIGLMVSIPTYADAVYYRIFLKNISVEGSSSGTIPPLTFLFRYDGSIYGNKEWEDLVEVDRYLTEEAGSSLGLPLLQVVRYATTEPFGLFADETSAFENTVSPLAWVGFSFISDLADHITVTEGHFPVYAPPEEGAAVEVLIHEDFAVQLGIQVGETYIAYTRVRDPEGFVTDLQLPVRVAGIWKAEDPHESYWFFRPQAFTERMLVPEETFVNTLGSQMKNEVYTAVWYLVMDGHQIQHTDANALIRRTMSVVQHAATLMPNTTLGRSPLDALLDYRRSSSLLTILLYAFSIPILGLLLAFISLTSSLLTETRRNEVAVLRSRGAMAIQMVGIAALESLLLGAVALGLSMPIGQSIARLMGQARSFLDFGAQLDALRVTVTMGTLRLGMLAVAVGMVAQVFPTFGAASHTIVSYKREQARMLRKPWWQRIGLDVLLFIPAAYGAYILRSQGVLVDLQSRFGGAPFDNPLLFLIPALGITALALFFLRFIPLIMSGVAWVVSHTRSVGLLMAARHLARSPSFYNTPLLLLILTLSLSAFTASLAHTLDRHLYDKTYYEAGADLRFLERGEGNLATGLGGLLGGAPGGEDTNAAPQEEGPRWFFLPVTEYLNAPGVEAVMRVARYPMTAQLSTGRSNGVFLGVERAQVPSISYWRDDFARDSLGALMNLLAVQRDGVLVPQDFLRENFLDVGDRIRIEVVTYGERNDIAVTVVGAFRYFPTWYPSDGPLIIGNLDYFFEQVGMQYPYEVWMKLAPDADIQYLVEHELDVYEYDWSAPRLEIEAEQALPERQGLFGLLSVGFVAAAVLTVVGFLLYALFSFRRRFIEFGVLRAVGLSTRQMSAFLGWELAFLIVMGSLVGTLLGGWVSSFFIPYLQIGVDEASRIPPYIVDVAWAEIVRVYALFSTLFVVAFVALIVMLRRMRIFEAVKLGETA